MCLMIRSDTNKPRIYQVLYYVYKTDDNMEEHCPNINNTDILPHEGHQVNDISEDDEVNQDTLSPGEDDEYYSSGEKYCG